MRGYFITGTDTEIGKTWVTALLARGLGERGHCVCPLKPLASGGVLVDGALVSEDALVYQQLGGVDIALSVLNPLCLAKPASPHLAAQLAGINLEPEAIVQQIQQTASEFDAVLVEGVGGWYVPITEAFWVSDFAKRLALPVIVVSANRLGTINHTLMTVDCIRQSGLEVAGVMINAPHPLQDQAIAEDNVQTITHVAQVPILGELPHLTLGAERLFTPSQWQTLSSRINWQAIASRL